MGGPVALTPGKIRGLAATSTPEGIFTILAIDHREAMRAVLDPDHPMAVPAAELTRQKLWLLAELGGEVSAVMLDPEYSAAQAITSRLLPGTVGFLSAVEAQGYVPDPAAPQATLLEGWSVEKAKRLGASGIKLLVWYRPGAGEVAENQERLIAAVIADCARHDIPLFLEPLAYPNEAGLSPDSDEVVAERRAVVIESVRRLGALAPEVLKVPFPVDTRLQPDRAIWADACAELDDASPVPWALLSGGDPYELFRDQVRIACQHGASGFMAGRALWAEAVIAGEGERDRIVEETVRPRLRELSGIAREHGRDWAERYAFPAVDETWYRGY